MTVKSEQFLCPVVDLVDVAFVTKHLLNGRVIAEREEMLPIEVRLILTNGPAATSRFANKGVV